jgi:hypothetical protein
MSNAATGNCTACIQGGLKALKDNKTLFSSDAAQAQNAADYTLNRKGYEQIESESKSIAA